MGLVADGTTLAPVTGECQERTALGRRKPSCPEYVERAQFPADPLRKVRERL
jgi:hypothetical protein